MAVAFSGCAHSHTSRINRGSHAQSPALSLIRPVHGSAASKRVSVPLVKASTATAVETVALDVGKHAAGGAAGSTGRTEVPTTEERKRPSGGSLLHLANGQERPLPGGNHGLDAQHFKLHESVARWHTFSGSKGLPAGASGSQALQQAASRLLTAASTRGDAQAYWIYHASRFGFFTSQAAVGLGAYLAHEASSNGRRWSGQGNAAELPLGNAFSVLSGREVGEIADGAGKELASLLNEAIDSWEQDYACIASSAFNVPWDMTTFNKQFDPLYLLGRTFEYAQEAQDILRRHTLSTPDPVWMRSTVYPQYYGQGFHYQTDGWLSSKSAELYDHSTESLFFGRQDAMQRAGLLPISEFVATSAKPAKEMTLLEVGAGTGRFHTFIKDNFPDMPTICSDLSPFYLQQARTAIQEWKQARFPNRQLGGMDNAGVLEYVQTAAESLAIPDNSVDIVTSTYMFHELPSAIRERAAREMFRVLKPGGLAVLVDSVQMGDRGDHDSSMANFTKLQEPYYTSYILENFGAMFARQGLQPRTKYQSSATKVLSFTKPE